MTGSRTLRRLRAALPLLVVGIVLSTGSAHATDPRIDDTATALKSYLTSLASTAQVPGIAKALPMSTLQPSGPSGLDLQNVFSSLSSKVTTGFDSASALASSLDGISDTDANGAHFALGCGGGSCASPVSANVVGDTLTLTVPLHLSRSATAPLSFAAAPLSVSNGSVPASISLDSTLVFTVNLATVGSDPNASLSLAPTTLPVSASVTNATVSVPVNLGLTTLTVGGTITNASLSLPLQLADPDSIGGVTLDEIRNTAPADLLSTSPTAALSASITADTTLIPGTPDVTVPFALGPDGFTAQATSTPSALTSLSAFTSVSPDTLLGGVGQLASGLSSLSAGSDLPLPLLHDGLANLAKLSQPVLDFVASQSVICGTEDKNPPVGDVNAALAAAEIFCSASALASVQNGTISWKPISGVTAAPDATHDNGNGTVTGPDPSVTKKRARFLRTTGPVVVEVTYRPVGATSDLRVTQPPATAQDLMDRLHTAAGFDNAPGSLAYDPSTRALTFHLVRHFDITPGTSHNATFDIGDKLKAITKIGGISAVTGAGDPTATVSVSMTGVTLDVTFGVLLVDHDSDVDPDHTAYGPYDAAHVTATSGPAIPPGPQDRFFIAPPATGHVLSIDDASATADLHLAGTLGFLGIDIEGASGGHALEFGKKTSGQPILAADFTPPGPGVPVKVGSSTVTIPHAVTLRGLGKLNVLDSSIVSKTLNAKLHAELVGKALISTGSQTTTLGQGGITIDVPDASAFLADPSTGITIDAGDFTTALGDFANIDAANPQALLSLLLNGLSSVLDRIDSATGAFSTPIPVLGKAPKDLFAQLADVKETLSELSGAPGPTITCGTSLGADGKLAGTPDNLAKADGSFSDVLCQGVLTKPLAPGSHPVWSIDAPGSAPVTVSGADTTVGDAAHPATTAVTLTAPATANDRGLLQSPDHPKGYRVHLTFEDTDSHKSVDLPSVAAPTSLQGFVSALTQKLGLPEGFLTVGVTTVHKGGTDVKALVLDVDAGICSAYFRALPASDANACLPGDGQLPASLASLPINLQLGQIGGVAGLNGQGSVDLDLLARANLGIAIPLTANPTPLILGNSGLKLQARATTSNLDFTANVGPVELKAGVGVDTDSATDGVQAGTGTAKVGLGVDVGRGSGNSATDAYAADDFFDGSFTASQPTSATQSCGTAIDGASTNVDLNGVACAKVSLALGDAYLGDVGFAADGITGPFHTAVPKSLTDRLASEVLSLKFLMSTLDSLVGELRDALDGAAKGVKLPVVGDALDAGANVADKLQAVTSALKSSPLVTLVPSSGEHVDAFISDVQSKAFGPANSTGVLRDTAAPSGVDPKDIGVTALCGGSACASGDDATTITQLRFHVELGQGDNPTGTTCAAADHCADGAAIPFDVGLKGLPVHASGVIAPHVGWKLVLDFGVDRVKGPFLGVGPSGTSAQVGASIGFGESESSCQTDIDPDPTTPEGHTGKAALDDVSAKRCLSGTLGFLGVNLRDKGSTPSSVGVKAALTLSNTGGGDTLSLNDLLAGQASADVSAAASADVHLRLRTGIKAGESVSLPSVIGILDITGGVKIGTGSGLTTDPFSVSFDNLYIDLGRSLSSFLGGIVGDVKRVTSPFRPIVDTLQAPLPVLTQLAALVGEPPVTLISLLSAVSGYDLSLVNSFLSVVQLINNLPDPASSPTLLVSLGGSGGGSFGINTAAASNDQTPDSAGDIINKTGNDFGSNLLNALSSVHPGSDPLNPQHSSYVSDTHDDPAHSTFGVQGLEFPIFASAGNIAKVLMGQDVKIVEYRMGTLKATAGFDITFGPFFIGPVPVDVFIGGSATLTGTFAFGYDTSGLRKVLDGASGEHLLDGLFLDDLDGSGNDIPELSLTGEVHAGAQVDLVVVKAGVEGGIRLTLNLNLHDDNHDGVLHIEEIANKLSNPICLFDVSGELDFFLDFFLEINLFFFSDSFTFEILNIKLLDFSASCSGSQPPRLAVQSGGTLTLLMGSQANRDARGLAVDQTDEKFVVRPITTATPSPTDPKPVVDSYSVTAFGLTQEYGPAAKGAGHSATPITQIVANGDDGKDQVSLVQGATPTDPPVTLDPTAKAVFDGGTGDDILVGGDNADSITGGDGNDSLTGGKNDDDLSGGKGNDTLDGALGNDVLHGGDDQDHLNGGGGADQVFGEAGNDVLDGGPAHPASSSDTPDQVAARDGSNLLVGGDGNDAITGGPGVDTVYGDEQSDSCSSTDNSGADHHQDTVDAGEGADIVNGGPGDDQLIGGPDNDTVCGGAGRDVVEGDNPTNPVRPGDDHLDGGSGNDQVFGRAGNDVITGGPGSDRITGEAGDDDIIGGDGNDVVDAGSGQDVVLGDAGSIDAGPHPAALSGRVAAAHPADSADTGALLPCPRQVDGAGYLTASETGRSDCLDGGADSDVVFGDGAGDQVTGGDGGDYLDGGHGADTMRGGNDGDTMYGRGEIDSMFGDSGNDLMLGNDQADVMRGGLGDDDMQGNADADTMYGDAGQDDMVGGSTSAAQPDAGDTLFGNAGADVITGDNALITRGSGNDPDDSTSQKRTVQLFDVDTTHPEYYGNDSVFAGDGNDRVYGQSGDDPLNGGADKDRMFGNQGSDTMHGDDGDDLMIGGSDGSGQQDAGDTMFGDNGADTVVGDNGTLTWAGALTPDDSKVAGSFGDDTMNGNAGDDVMYGELGSDTMHGNAGHDRMLGDLGTVTPVGSGPAADPDGVPRSTTSLLDPETGSPDFMYGDADSDRMWGGMGSDTVEGGPGNDYLEGNDGADTLRGFNATVDDGTDQPSDAVDRAVMALGDDDDIIGGSSPANPDSTKRDVGETLIQGNGGFDVILGDNGSLTRTPTGDNSAWVQDVVQKGPARTISLDDTSRPAAQLPLVSGGDTIQGNDGNDKAFGEGGNDVINGNGGDDVVVGNQDSDVIHGDAGEDDVVGGSLGGDTGPGLVAKGQLDAGDRLYGDADQDVVVGDNAQVTRPFTGLLWDLDPITGGHQRNVTLWDTERTTAQLVTVSGNDLGLGGTGSDRMFGEAGNDTFKGNDGDDFVQGNQGSDLLEGNDGEDDIVGGSRTAGQLDGDDIIHGGGGADVAIGDNGLIDRSPLNTNGPYDYVTYQLGQTSKRSVKLFDIDTTNPDIAGGDQVAGGQGVDVLFGQGENDYVFGGTEDDYLEGNAATDFEFGDLNPEQVGPGNPAQLTSGLPALPGDLPVEDGKTAPKSPQPQLDGPAGVQGQDDIIGGSSTAGRTDATDYQYGNGNADFLLGDNGQLVRTISSGAYLLYTTYDNAVQRTATRFCTAAQATCEPTGRSGGDYQEGNDGNDRIWGQDGNDTQYGGNDNDDLLGELGDDTQFGEAGEDAMVGDRGRIVDTLLTQTDPNASATTNGPAFFVYNGMKAGSLDRRVDLTKELSGAALVHPGESEGGADRMRGGLGHDSMHGAQGDDLMNGDSGGDWLFGDDGGDVMWGGKGSDNPLTPNARNEEGTANAAIGIHTDNLVDYLFGGFGGSSTSPGAEFTGGSDILDWRPRPGVDPAAWFQMTNTDNDPATISDNQHHQGIDWIYGGFDRDVLQGDVGKNGPDDGDRLMDWDGNFNLYSRCNSSYGDDGDIRQHSPALQNLLQTLAYGSGAGSTRPELNDPDHATPGAHELALVYPGDKGNNGKPYPTSPGHFDQNACTSP